MDILANITKGKVDFFRKVNLNNNFLIFYISPRYNTFSWNGCGV